MADELTPRQRWRQRLGRPLHGPRITVAQSALPEAPRWPLVYWADDPATDDGWPYGDDHTQIAEWLEGIMDRGCRGWYGRPGREASC